jgi:hypothetical protein
LTGFDVVLEPGVTTERCATLPAAVIGQAAALLGACRDRPGSGAARRPA